MRHPFLISLILIVLTCPSAQARQSTQAAFLPSPQAIALVEKTINSAKTTVDVAAYSFTSPKVTKALIATHHRGVMVQIVIDKSQARRLHKVISDLYEIGIPIRVDRRYAIMHNKYIIVDDKTVETGSFNFTTSAEKRNAENVLVIKNNPKLAKTYLANWRQLWAESEDYKP